MIPTSIWISFEWMKHVSILVPESCVMEAVADPRYLFTAANQFLQASGMDPLFEVKLVGAQNEIRLHDGAFSVHADHTFADAGPSDLIVIPALFGDMSRALELNRDAREWLISQYHKGTELASLCVGAFLLADTGLLDGKKCSTHWAYYNEFREKFPTVEMVEGHIITEEHRIYSSGGANSYWNLLLHLLEKYTNRDIAILAAKYFAIDIDRENQSAFAMFQGQKNHHDEEIRQAQEFLEANFAEKVSVDELADRFAMSRRSFERRFKQATSNTVLEYLQRLKIEAAKRSFEATRKNINEVMFDVGYTDTKAFRTLFKRLTGLTPLEYRNKYNRMTPEVKRMISVN